MSNLVIIPCCKRKDENEEELFPEEKKVVDFLKDEQAKQLLKEGRNRCEEKGDVTGQKPLSALSMYIGYLYNEELKDLIKAKLRNDFHVLIESASYGLLRPEEKILNYDKKMGENYNIWKERLPCVLEAYIKDNYIERAYALFGKTTAYYKIIKRCNWALLKSKGLKNVYFISPIKGNSGVTPRESGKVAAMLIKNNFNINNIDKERFCIREV